MDPSIVIAIAKTILDGLVQLISLVSSDPKSSILELIDEHPLIIQMQADVKAAEDAKFGPQP